MNQTLIDGIEDMVYVMRVGEDGKSLFYQLVNQAVRDALLFADDLIGKEIRATSPADSVDWLLKQYEMAIAKQKPHHYQDQFNSPFSGERIAQTTLTPIIEADRVTFVIAVTRDITSQKKVERQRNISNQRLKVSRQRYKSLFDENTDPTAYLNMSGKIIRMNKACQQFINKIYRKDQERNIFDLLKMSDEDLVIRKFEETKLGLPQSVDISIMSEDEYEVKLKINFIPMTLENRVEGVYLIFKDMTAELFAKEALLKSEERFRLIAENSSDLIQIVDQDGYLSYISPSHQRVLGFNSVEFEQKKLVDFVAEKYIDKVEVDLDLAIKEKNTKRVEVKFRHAEGDYRWFEMKIEPVFSADGNYHHTNIVARDIEERKSYEKELRRLAYRDPLTGLANRRLFDSQMDKVIAKTERDEIPFAVIMLDLDNFKEVNDDFGHDAGDQVIIQMSKRILNTVRDMDTVGRLGGDEFIILLPEIENKTNLTNLIRRLEQNLKRPYQIENTYFKVGVSFGAVLSDHQAVSRQNTVVTAADKALYAAKRAGKNRSVIL
ncbi:sensor domain-containing protein [Amphibacillus indicireducens]|uniref:Diguanylate cyclase n=1 Tax=Amphibacillus indicireducens TaxID=1076330 RepID=A0ABP7VSK3_9BACI